MNAYHGSHRPDLDGPPLHDLEKAFPDLYARPDLYRGHSDSRELDDQALAVISSARGTPEALVTIWRAVPPGVETINAGDWVSITEAYARQHAIQDNDPANDWPVISTRVPARTLRTEGNSIHEYGYNPI